MRSYTQFFFTVCQVRVEAVSDLAAGVLVSMRLLWQHLQGTQCESFHYNNTIQNLRWKTACHGGKLPVQAIISFFRNMQKCQHCFSLVLLFFKLEILYLDPRIMTFGCHLHCELHRRFFLVLNCSVGLCIMLALTVHMRMYVVTAIMCICHLIIKSTCLIWHIKYKTWNDFKRNWNDWNEWVSE